MEIIKEEDFKKQLTSAAGRAFLFFGEEDYLKIAAVKALRAQLCPDEGMAFFNDVTIDFTDYTPDKLLDTMAAPPMMTDAKLIVLRGFDFTATRANELASELCEVLSQLEEYDYNCVVIYAAAEMLDPGFLPKRPSPLLKRLAEVATPVQFNTPTDARLTRWAGKHFAHYGVAATPAVCQQLIAYAGKTMFVLANEIQKLASFVKENGRSEVTVADIHTVSVPASLPDAFALSNAILAGDGKAALDALAIMKFERTEPNIILAEISALLFDMQAARVLFAAGKNIKEVGALLGKHEYKVGLIANALSRTTPQRLARVIERCAEADFALKNTAVARGDYAPIEKLICSL